LVENIELGLISLYHALDPTNFDVNQLGDAAQADHMSADPSVTLPGLTAAVDLELRRDRYAASLAYVLGLRFVKNGGSLDAELQELGGAIVARFGHSDPLGEGEAALRAAVSELIDDQQISESVAEALTVAFEGKVVFTLDPDTQQWTIEGEATEAALMLSELGSMGTNCNMRNVRVPLGNTEVEVLVLECEVCTQLPWERVKRGADPRNWDDVFAGFFDNIEVVVPATPPPAGTWNGIIQEKVGALILGTPLITNLVVSYFEAPRLAVTTYDLAPENALPPAKDDDARVKVDYGFWAATDEGVHRRIRLLKVVRIEDTPWPAWFHPLWAQQLLMMGFWVS